MKVKNCFSVFLVIVLLQGFLYGCKNQDKAEDLNRNEKRIILTKHARCRMDCRNITIDEIKEILHNGNINYNKSNLNDKRGADYALEGYTNEHQHLRVVFSPADDGLVVVTCIDLDKEWQCNGCD